MNIFSNFFDDAPDYTIENPTGIVRGFENILATNDPKGPTWTG